MGDDLFFACRCGLPECEPCLANAEIERLRAEVKTLQTWRNADVETFHRQKDEIERLRAAGAALYALLDEMHKCGRRQPGLTEALEGWEAVVAATKEDADGR